MIFIILKIKNEIAIVFWLYRVRNIFKDFE
jgi:hypothetical protein